ncbi:radical SAM protein [uncultured Brachyspira sp.]|uniref:radical SAM protein n=1 Tax=uncultured Brachyspira sp. TaxID=221953 RepID=UPI0026079F93|nr:radical SAM protein [uncultured Brachyspira sp.]
MIKKIKILLDKYFITGLEKINPDLYRLMTYNTNKIYSEIVNSIKYKDKYFFHSVSLEISSYCNRKCHYCPNKDNETPKEFMSWDIFKHSVEELKNINYTGIFQYHLFNEPLYDERLVELVKYTSLHLPKVIQVLISNGDLLTIEKASELSDAGINKFVVTVHDLNPQKNLERLKPVKEFLKEKMRLQTSNELYLTNRGGGRY